MNAANDDAAGAGTPLPDRIADGQAVGKTRYQFVLDETRPVVFIDADTMTDVAAEQELGNFSRLLVAVA